MASGTDVIVLAVMKAALVPTMAVVEVEWHGSISAVAL